VLRNNTSIRRQIIVSILLTRRGGGVRLQRAWITYDFLSFRQAIGSQCGYARARSLRQQCSLRSP